MGFLYKGTKGAKSTKCTKGTKGAKRGTKGAKSTKCTKGLKGTKEEGAARARPARHEDTSAGGAGPEAGAGAGVSSGWVVGGTGLEGPEKGGEASESLRLGNISIDVTTWRREQRKIGYLRHRQLRQLLRKREAQLKAQCPWIDDKRALASIEPEARESIQKEVRLLRHSSRFCGERVIPSHRKNREGQKVETGMPGRAEVHSQEGENIKFLTGTQFCASPWFCLNCAPIFYKERRQELEQAFDYFREKKKTFAFVTLTIPHTAKNTFTELMPRLSEAVRELRRVRGYQLHKDKYGLEHIIRATEATFSKRAGPHPHYHMLLVYGREAFTEQETAEIERFWKNLWSRVCRKLGLIETPRDRHFHLKHGCHVKVGSNPVRWEYMSKIKVWEMASTTSKTPKATGSLSMWDVQALATMEPKTDEEEKEQRYYERVWIDFMRAFRGRTALRWSNGLKVLVGLHADEGKGPSIPEYHVPPQSLGRVNRHGLRVYMLEGLEGTAARVKATVEYFRLERINDVSRETVATNVSHETFNNDCVSKLLIE